MAGCCTICGHRIFAGHERVIPSKNRLDIDGPITTTVRNHCMDHHNTDELHFAPMFEVARVSDFIDPAFWQHEVELLGLGNDEDALLRACTTKERIQYIQYILFKSYLNTRWQNFSCCSSHEALVNECLCHITLWEIYVLSSEEKIRNWYKEDRPNRYKWLTGLNKKSELVEINKAAAGIINKIHKALETLRDETIPEVFFSERIKDVIHDVLKDGLPESAAMKRFSIMLAGRLKSFPQLCGIHEIVE